MWAENLALLREKVPVAQRVLGPHHPVMLQFRSALAYAIFTDENTSRDDRRAQVAVFEDIARVARQVLGAAHPLTMNFENNATARWASILYRSSASSLAGRKWRSQTHAPRRTLRAAYCAVFASCSYRRPDAELTTRVDGRVVQMARPVPHFRALYQRPLRRRLDVPFRGRLQHAMPEVQDVHARPAGALDACFHCFFHFLDRTE